MRLTFILLAASVPFASSPLLAADPAHPAVVELFESQGCSSCPPANATLNAVAGDPNVLALNFAVTYWDHLGWKDTFAQPAFTQRQWDYARAGGRAQVATPQMIVNGAAVLNGGNRQELVDVLRRADRGVSGPVIAFAGGRVTVGAAHATSAATVWLVRYDARTIAVPIRAGENEGKTLPHRNVVRSLVSLGEWRGAAVSLPLPAFRFNDPNLRSALLVQQGTGGRILAAARF